MKLNERTAKARELVEEWYRRTLKIQATGDAKKTELAALRLRGILGGVMCFAPKSNIGYQRFAQAVMYYMADDLTDRILTNPKLDTPPRPDKYGRSWRLSDDSLCLVCGQPDTEADCNHEDIGDDGAAMIGDLIPKEKS